MQKALVSVTGVDKPGIIARVSTALFELNINVLEISQTILDGYFTMLMIVDITNATAAFSEAARMEEVGRELGEGHQHPAHRHLRRHAPHLTGGDTMIEVSEILQTIRMVSEQHFDIRTITMGISLLTARKTPTAKPRRPSMTRSPAWRAIWCAWAASWKASWACRLSTSASA